MRALRNPIIYFVMMTLVMSVAVVWASIFASCIEIGLFWVSVATALSVTLYAWRNGDRIGQGTMLLVYFLLACSITLAVTSVVDVANFSLLGDRYDAETGILLGGLIACGTIFGIAVRCSRRFPASLSWGALLAYLMAHGYGLFYGKAILPEYLPIVTVASLLAGIAAFISLSICKNNLTANQYLSVLTIIVAVISFSSPSTLDNFAAGFAASVLLFLAGLLFFAERRIASVATRVAGIMLLYIGFTSMVQDAVNRGIGINETVAGIPGLLCSMIVIVWIRFRKSEIPRGLYWISLFVFGAFGISGVIPESQSEALVMPLLSSMILFIVTCAWYAASPSMSASRSWRIYLRYGYAASCFVIALTISVVWFVQSVNMLVHNTGATRLLVPLKHTLFWPGDTVFVRLAMKEVSLWGEDVGTALPEKLSLNRYLKAIRPGGDRFSGIVDTKADQAEELGFDNKGIGVFWVAENNTFNLTKVNGRSAAGRAGLARGDRVISINGTPVKDLKDDAVWKKLLSEWKAGTIVLLNVSTRSGINKNVSMAVDINPQDPPKSSIVTTANGTKVGYLYLECFNSAQFKEINTHFAAFRKEEVHDLVLDLRYNSGGIMENASVLANLIGGQALDSKTFIRWKYAPKNEDRNSEYKFKRLPESLHTRRLVVLTTDETCSASETIINGLRPYMPVFTVGSTTCGKPFGMDGVVFGDKTLYPVTARVVNSRGEGDYASGLRADYSVKDDLTHQLGDPQEGMLKKALEILEKKR